MARSEGLWLCKPTRANTTERWTACVWMPHAASSSAAAKNHAECGTRGSVVWNDHKNQGQVKKGPPRPSVENVSIIRRCPVHTIFFPRTMRSKTYIIDDSK